CVARSPLTGRTAPSVRFRQAVEPDDCLSGRPRTRGYARAISASTPRIRTRNEPTSMRGVCSYRQSRGRGGRRDIDFGGTMHRYRLWLLAGLAFAALIVAATGSASSQSAKAGGTVVFGAEQEPGILNTDIIGGNLFWGTEVVSPVFPTA